MGRGKPEVLEQLWDSSDDSGRLGVRAQEGEAAGHGRTVDRARDQEAGAALFQGPRGRDQRAALGGRLDDDRRVGESADQPVPPRKRAASG